MPYLRSPRLRNITLLAMVLIILVAGTSAIAKVAIEYLLYKDAVSSGHNWASYLAQNVSDLGRIIHGDKPSAASMAFFEKAQKVGNVFRYKIYDAQGHLRLISDELNMPVADEKDPAERDEEAAVVLATGPLPNCKRMGSNEVLPPLLLVLQQP